MGRTLVIVLAALLGLALAFEALTWGRIVPGVTALGLDVGGLSREAAAERLASAARAALDRPLLLVAGPWERTATPRELGLLLDVDEIVDAALAVGRSANPLQRTSERVEATVFGRSAGGLGDYDRTALEAYLRQVAREVERPPEDAVLHLDADYQPRLTSARMGLEFDVPASVRLVGEALAGGQERVSLVVRESPAALRDEHLELVYRELEAILAGPLVLGFQEREWQMEPPEVADLLSLEVRPGSAASLRIDAEQLRERLEQIAHELDQEPQDARFDWTPSGLNVIRESRDGRRLELERAVHITVEALRSGTRRVELPVEVAPPAVASSEAERLGIPELIEHGKTSYAGSIAEKKHNIELAAERLNGVVVPPGGMFSFNREVGPTTLQAGFQWGYGITSAGDEVRTVPSVAGGICQVATTLFHPVFWAGYQLEERHWHLYWIPGYTSRGVEGLDVTVDEDAGLDFKFINPTPDQLLIQAWTENDELHFALYGRAPDWIVEVDPPQVANQVPADEEMVFEAAPTLPWERRLQVEGAREGFDVLVVRRVASESDVRTLRLRSTYRPSRNVTLVGVQGAPPDQDVEALLEGLREAESEQNRPVRGDPEESDREDASGETAPAPTPDAASTAPPAE